jgi:hypothetical protein
MTHTLQHTPDCECPRCLLESLKVAYDSLKLDYREAVSDVLAEVAKEETR